MIEIKSENLDEGFVLYITHQGISKNIAVTHECMKNPFRIQENLNRMINSLLFEIFPELNDGILISEEEINKLNEKINFYKNYIFHLKENKKDY